MTGALFVDSLCVCPGVILERRLSINTLLKRMMLIFSVGAGQLMLAIEFLSLWNGLSGVDGASNRQEALAERRAQQL